MKKNLFRTNYIEEEVVESVPETNENEELDVLEEETTNDTPKEEKAVVRRGRRRANN